jgi:(2Fe-2S) ferredoxin
MVRGAGDLLQALSHATGAPVDGSSEDGAFRLRSFECLGACDIAPMASIDGQYRGPLTPEDASEIAAHVRAERPIEELLPSKHYVGDYGRRVAQSPGHGPPESAP